VTATTVDSVSDRETRGERPVGWYADPFGRYEQRWYDGTKWSEKIRSSELRGIDPPGIDVAPVAVPASVDQANPAAPIEDAMLPISRPRIADRIALFVGCLVFLGLIAVFVVALTA